VVVLLNSDANPPIAAAVLPKLRLVNMCSLW